MAATEPVWVANIHVDDLHIVIARTHHRGQRFQLATRVTTDQAARLISRWN